MGQREIRVEFKPQLRPIGVGPFDPIAPSRPARPRVASVTAEDDLGSFIKDEQAYRRVEARKEFAADLSLSETQSCWQLISNRAMLLPYARGL